MWKHIRRLAIARGNFRKKTGKRYGKRKMICLIGGLKEGQAFPVWLEIAKFRYFRTVIFNSGGDRMKRLRTEAIAQLLHQPCETVRAMIRTQTVDWGVYIKPKKARYGRGQYVYYPSKFAEATGLSMAQVEAIMT